MSHYTEHHKTINLLAMVQLEKVNMLLTYPPFHIQSFLQSLASGEVLSLESRVSSLLLVGFGFGFEFGMWDV